MTRALARSGGSRPRALLLNFQKLHVEDDILANFFGQEPLHPSQMAFLRKKAQRKWKFGVLASRILLFRGGTSGTLWFLKIEDEVQGSYR